ncbi:hypothetical protein SDC9_191837 [bioreactor metagenome]|uniref:Uncharacterized protein n=1 Tax=bioreactor metagenome TaxID=1076179 RepID=A0A645HZ09_9ZZZZ
MRDGRQDAGTIADMLADALLHLVEGCCGLRNLHRAAGIHRRAVGVFTQGARRRGHSRQRAGGDTHTQPGKQADADKQCRQRWQQAARRGWRQFGQRGDTGQTDADAAAVTQAQAQQQGWVGAVTAAVCKEHDIALWHGAP